MVIPNFPSVDGIDDGEKRKLFVVWVKESLDCLVNEKEYEHLFVDELVIPMRSAWKEAKPLFEDFEKEVVNLEDGVVEQHGLAGAQLDFKLATVRHWAGIFLSSALRPILRWLLKAIDTLLKSLLSATPVGTALEEMKDAISDAIDEDK